MTLSGPVVRRTVSGVLDYEYQRMTLPRGTSRNAAQRVLVEAAERGHWELERVRLFPDGSRKVVLRRRIIRVRSTLPAPSADAGQPR